MIAHIILLRPRDGLVAAERAAVLAALRAAASEIPTLRSCRIGRRVRHGLPGYEQLMREDFEYAAILEFEDLDGLKAYLTHPRHAELGRHFIEMSATALAYDYATADIADGASLLS